MEYFSRNSTFSHQRKKTKKSSSLPFIQHQHDENADENVGNQQKECICSTKIGETIAGKVTGRSEDILYTCNQLSINKNETDCKQKKKKNTYECKFALANERIVLQKKDVFLRNKILLLLLMLSLFFLFSYCFFFNENLYRFLQHSRIQLCERLSKYVSADWFNNDEVPIDDDAIEKNSLSNSQKETVINIYKGKKEKENKIQNNSFSEKLRTICEHLPSDVIKKSEGTEKKAITNDQDFLSKNHQEGRDKKNLFSFILENFKSEYKKEGSKGGVNPEKNVKSSDKSGFLKQTEPDGLIKKSDINPSEDNSDKNSNVGNDDKNRRDQSVMDVINFDINNNINEQYSVKNINENGVYSASHSKTGVDIRSYNDSEKTNTEEIEKNKHTNTEKLDVRHQYDETFEERFDGYFDEHQFLHIIKYARDYDLNSQQNGLDKRKMRKGSVILRSYGNDEKDEVYSEDFSSRKNISPNGYEDINSVNNKYHLGTSNYDVIKTDNKLSFGITEKLTNQGDAETNKDDIHNTTKKKLQNIPVNRSSNSNNTDKQLELIGSQKEEKNKNNRVGGKSKFDQQYMPNHYRTENENFTFGAETKKNATPHTLLNKDKKKKGTHDEKINNYRNFDYTKSRSLNKFETDGINSTDSGATTREENYTDPNINENFFEWNYKTVTQIRKNRIKTYFLLLYEDENSQKESSYVSDGTRNNYKDTMKELVEFYKNRRDENDDKNANIGMLFITLEKRYIPQLAFCLPEDIEEQLPIAIIIEMDHGWRKYIKADNVISLSSMKSFLILYLQGKAQRYMRSEVQESDEDIEDRPLKSVVATNFHKYVVDSDYDALVLFYTGWCGHCKRFEKKFKKFAKEYSYLKSVRFFKLDVSKNDVDHPHIIIEKVPHVRFFRAGKKNEEPLKFDHSATDTLQYGTGYLYEFARCGKAIRQGIDCDIGKDLAEL